MSESKSLLKPNAWEAFYKEKFHKPAREFVVEFFKKVELLDNQKIRGTAIDLGAGVGHETFLLLEKGFNKSKQLIFLKSLTLLVLKK